MSTFKVDLIYHARIELTDALAAKWKKAAGADLPSLRFVMPVVLPVPPQKDVRLVFSDGKNSWSFVPSEVAYHLTANFWEAGTQTLPYSTRHFVNLPKKFAKAEDFDLFISILQELGWKLSYQRDRDLLFETLFK